MKYRLPCVLFGHLFIIKHEFYNGEKMVGLKWEPQDNCVECGLSKKEVGITT
jgi:hypothetical protein